MFSILLPLALVRAGGISGAVATAALALAGWIALDRAVGLTMAVGWAFQLVGHAWEGPPPGAT